MARVFFVLGLVVVAVGVGCGRKADSDAPTPNPGRTPIAGTRPDGVPAQPAEDPANEWFQRSLTKDPAWVKTAAASDAAAAELQKRGVKISGGANSRWFITLEGNSITNGRIEPEIVKLLANLILDGVNLSRVSDAGFKELLELPGMRYATRLIVFGVDGLGDATLARVCELRSLYHLALHPGDNMTITSAGLAPLKTRKLLLTTLEVPGLGMGDGLIDALQQATDLKRIDLSKNPITDAGGRKLAAFKQLDEVLLARTGIGDATVSEIARPELEQIDVSETAVSDGALNSLSACRKLTILKCARTKITDAGLASVAKCAALRELDVSGTAITDTGFKHLAGLPKLERLNLLQTQLTRDSLPVLASLPGLDSVYFPASSKITENDAQEFRKQKPKVSFSTIED